LNVLEQRKKDLDGEVAILRN